MDTRPLVVDADDLKDDPEGTINAYCRALGIPFLPESLSWESEHQEEWDIWKDWHTNAAQSTGIQKNMETFDVTGTTVIISKRSMIIRCPIMRRCTPGASGRRNRCDCCLV